MEQPNVGDVQEISSPGTLYVACRQPDSPGVSVSILADHAVPQHIFILVKLEAGLRDSPSKFLLP